MTSPTHLALRCAALAATILTAHAQTVTNVSSVTDETARSSTGGVLSTIASSYAFAERVPAIDNVTLEKVQTTSDLTAQIVVTVRNPTANPLDASLRLIRAFAVDGTFGDWGPGVDDTTNVFVPISALQPGETRTVTWNFADTFASMHTPTATTGGLWTDVLDSCIGTGNVEFGSYMVAEFRRVLPSAVEVLSVDVSASVAMELELTSALANNSSAVPFCPNPIFGSSTPAIMEAFGTLNAVDLDYCLLRTSFIPDGLPAIAYVTTAPANLTTAAGTICLGGQRVFRTEPQLGSSTAPLDFRLEPVMGAAGMSVYAQTFYRTRTQGLRVTGAIELPLQ